MHGCMRNLFVAVLLFSLPLLSAKQENSLLFVIHAKSGTLAIDDMSYGLWKLTLKDVDESVAFFTEAPNRHAGTYAVVNFLQLWQQGNEMKNGGFIFFEVGNVNYNEIPLEVHNPIYNAQNNTLTFDVHLLQDEFAGKTEQLKEITLFIELEALQDKSFPSTLLSPPDQPPLVDLGV